MMNIYELVQMICLEDTNKKIKIKNMVIVLDVSYSTGQLMSKEKGMTILKKEIEEIEKFISLHPDDNYELYSFDSNAIFHGKLNYNKEEDLIIWPSTFLPGTSTNTCAALKLISNNSTRYKPDEIYIYTDGKTDNKLADFTPLVQKFKSDNVKINIVAVSNSDINMEIITANEERNIPGMDIVNMLGNDINLLLIFNRFHEDTPFNGITNTSINKNSIYFCDTKVNGFIIDFINRLIDELEINKNNIDWGIKQKDLKRMLSEIGKLLSILFIQFPITHPFLKNICFKIENSIKTSTQQFEMNMERIYNIIEYAYKCSKEGIPVPLTNFEGHLKETTTKLNEFADAVSLLKKKEHHWVKIRK